jgi:hypothetical protein
MDWMMTMMVRRRRRRRRMVMVVVMMMMRMMIMRVMMRKRGTAREKHDPCPRRSTQVHYVVLDEVDELLAREREPKQRGQSASHMKNPGPRGMGPAPGDWSDEEDYDDEKYYPPSETSSVAGEDKVRFETGRSHQALLDAPILLDVVGRR